MNAVKAVSALALVSFFAASAGAVTTFEELQAAIKAAPTGSTTITVENDMEFTAALAIDEGQTITLEGKDKRMCPEDPRYRQYIADVFTAIARERPALVMLDDDVQMKFF